MPSLDVHVALSEALEVQGGPLREPQIWAVLCQTAEAIQDLFIKDLVHDGHMPRYLITPDTLLFCHNGRIKFGKTSFRDSRNERYIPPELFTNPAMTEEVVDKMFVFSLGITLYAAGDYGLSPEEDINLSQTLDSLISSMCEENPTDRIALVHILETCSNHAGRFTAGYSYSHYVSHLYKLVLGSTGTITAIFPEEEDENRFQGKRKSFSPSDSGLSLSRSRSRSPHQKAEKRMQSQRKERRIREEGKSLRSRKSRSSRQDEDLESSTSTVNSRHQQSHFPPTRERLAHLGRAERSYHLSDITFGSHGNTGYHASGMNIPPGLEQQISPNSSQGSNWGERHSSRSVEETYNRLKERRRKLAILRHGLNLEDYSSRDGIPLSDLSSDFGERKSLISANSYTYGSYRPDLYARYGSEVALRMGHDSSSDPQGSSLSSEPQYPVKQARLDAPIVQRHLDTEWMGEAAGPARLPSTIDIDPDPRYRNPASLMGKRQTITDNSKQAGPYSQDSDGKMKPKAKQKKHNLSNKKNYVGPEFVANASEPVIELNLPQNSSSKGLANNREILVILLDGHKVHLSCSPNTTGKALFDLIVTYINLPEYHFFGLTHVKDGEHTFIDPETKLHKVAPAGWKEPAKGQHSAVVFTVFFRVKFYVDASVLRHPMTRHLFYLQVRRDILEDRTHCKDEDALSLTALALQAEYGDYIAEAYGRNYFRPEDYLPQRTIRKLGSGYLRDNLPSLHKGHLGVSDIDCETGFLKEAQRLTEYGIHYYKVLKNKGDKTSTVLVGIGIQGVALLESRGGLRRVTHQHPWQYTQKISFNRRKFSIQPKSDVGNLKLGKITYYTDSYRKGRYLLQLSTAHHRFLMKIRSRANLSHMFQREYPYDRAEYMQRQEISSKENFSSEEEEPVKDDEDDIEIVEEEAPYAVVRQTRASYDTVDVPHRSPPFVNEHEGDDRIQQLSMQEPQRISRAYEEISVPAEPLYTAVHKQRLAKQEHPYGTPLKSENARVIDASIRSRDRTLFPNTDETISDSLQERLDNLSPPEVKERRIVVVSLSKPADKGLGILIAGGDGKALDEGIYVKSVIPGSPADVDGRISPGDHIIAINGQSMEEKTQKAALKIIKEATFKVDFVLSQVKDVNNTSGSSGRSQVAEQAENRDNVSQSEDRQKSIEESKIKPKILTVLSRTPGAGDSLSAQGQPVSVYSAPIGGSTVKEQDADVDEEDEEEDENSDWGMSSAEESDMEVADILPQEKNTPSKPPRKKKVEDSSNNNPYEPVDFVTQPKIDHRKTPVEARSTPQQLRGGTPEVRRTTPQIANEVIMKTGRPQNATPVRMTPQNMVELVRPQGHDVGQLENIPGNTNTGRISRNAPEAEESELEMSPTPQVSVPRRHQLDTDDEFSTPDIIKNTPQLQPQRPNSNFSSAMGSSPASMGGYETSTSAQSHQSQELKTGDKYEVVLEKMHGSLGLNVTGGINTSVKLGGIYVKSLVPGGAAERIRKIQIGDRVIEVNEVSLEGVTHKQAVETLRNAPHICRLSMERGEPLQTKMESPHFLKSDTPTTQKTDFSEDMVVEAPGTGRIDDTHLYDFVTEENTYEVPLIKGSSGLGFSVLGGRGAHPTDPVRCIVRVRKVFPLGPAAASGRLEVGDVILEVNGTKVRGLTHGETVTLLRTAPSDVKLLICRPSPTQLPPIVDRGRESPFEDRVPTPKSMSPATVASGLSVVQESQSPVKSPLPISPLVSSPAKSPFHHSGTPVQQQGVKSPPPFSGSAQQTVRPTLEERPASSMSESSSEETETEHSVSPDQWTRGQSTVDQSERTSDVSGRQTPIGQVEHTTMMEDSPPSLLDNGQRIESPHKFVSRQESGQSQGVAPYVSKQSSQRSVRSQPKVVSRADSIQSSEFSRTESVASDSDASAPPSPTPADSSEEEEEEDEESGEEEEESEALDVPPPPMKPGEFEVTLIKSIRSGLGFTVAGGTMTTGGCYVKAVVQDPALSDGRMQAGDKLILVNGKDVTGFSHFDCVSFLRNTPQEVTIRLHRGEPPKPPQQDKKQGQQSFYPESSSESEEEEEDEEEEDAEKVEKTKSVKDLAAEFETNKDVIKPHDYRSVSHKQQPLEAPSSPEGHPGGSGQAGGDTSLSSLDHSKRSVASRSSVSSWGDISLPLSDTDDNKQKISGIAIQLTKSGNEGFGFGLVSGPGGTGVYVKTIASGGVADRDGQLKVGDHLIKVNEESVQTWTHNQAVNLLRKSSGQVTLVVERSSSKEHSPISKQKTLQEEEGETGEGSDEEEEEEIKNLLQPKFPQDKAGSSSDTDSDVDSTALDADEDGDVFTGQPSHERLVAPPLPLSKPPSQTNHEETENVMPPPLPPSPPPDSSSEDEESEDEEKEENEEELVPGGLTGPKSNTPLLPKAPPPGASSDEDSDSWGDDSDNSLPDGQDKREEVKQVNSSEEESSSEKEDTVPQTITDGWVSQLPIVTPVPSGQYSGKALQSVISQLTTKLKRDDPVEEYKNLRQVKLTDNCDDAKAPENKSKNRYRNVLPYDSNRVILTGSDDYINASHIKLTVGKEEHQYIACQGPLPQTTGDFWRMVWEYKVQMIAMVTMDMEAGKVKCHCYWPESMETPMQVYGRYQLSLLRETILQHVHIRYLKLEDTKTSKSQEVIHLNFTSWPDNGVPQTATPLLQYIQLLHALHESGPVVVHCSAGIGRTGTLITIATALTSIEKNLKFDICEIVSELRKQRPGMIQTKDQYLFCYTACIEALGTITS